MSSNLKLVLTSVILAVAIILTFALQRWSGPSSIEMPPPVEAAGFGELESPIAGETDIASAGTDGERVVASEVRPDAAQDAVLAAPLLEGRVVDGVGEPVAGLTVLLERMDRSTGSWEAVPDTPTAITSDLGVFRLPGTSAYGRAGGSSYRHVTVLGAPWPPNDRSVQPTVVVGERSSYAGIVVDREGAAIPGASISLRLESAVLKKLFHGEERPLEETWSARTGEGGAFEMKDVGWLPGTTLIVTLEPFQRAEVALDPGDHRDLQVVLERPSNGESPLHGRVVRADGGPVVGAHVAYAGGQAVAGAPDGSFAVDLGKDPEPGTLIAVLGGYLPARLEISDPRSAAKASRSTPVVLQVEGPALTIAGEVVGSTGKAIPKAWVWTEDGIPLSRTRAVEDFAATGTQFPGVGRRAEVDADGRFEINGLLHADYDLHAVHPKTFEVVTVSGVSAGTQDVRVVFDTDFSGVRVAGRVLYRDGAPAPGVRLYPMMGARSGTGLGRPPFLVHSSCTTGAEGRFEFPSLHPKGLHLWVTGMEIGETAERIELDRCADLEEIEIRVPHRVRFEVLLLGDPEEADRFGVADGEGRTLQLQSTLMGTGRATSVTGPKMKLSAGRSEVVSCSEDARTLILCRGDEEVRRVPLSLKVGEVQVLKL